MANFFIHPYEGYLNTSFTFLADDTLDVVDSYDGRVYHLDKNVGSTFKLKAGTHKFTCKDKGLERPIFVKDAYRFGGSQHKCSFVFDDSPWCVVVMKDRSYFYNRDTEESFMEAISPDSIRCVSANLLLFENENEIGKTIFSLVTHAPLVQFENEIYVDGSVVIGHDDQNHIHIYKISEDSSEESVFHYETYYYDTQNKRLYLYEDHSIKTLDIETLTTSDWKIVDTVEHIEFIGQEFVAIVTTTSIKDRLAIENILTHECVFSALTPRVGSINGSRYVDYEKWKSSFCLKSKDAMSSCGGGQSSETVFAEFQFKVAGSSIYYIENLVTFKSNKYHEIWRTDVAYLKVANKSLKIELTSKFVEIKSVFDLFSIRDMRNRKVFILHNGDVAATGDFDVYVNERCGMLVSAIREPDVNLSDCMIEGLSFLTEEENLTYFEEFCVKKNSCGEWEHVRSLRDRRYGNIHVVSGIGKLEKRKIGTQSVLLLNNNVVGVNGNVCFTTELPCTVSEISAISASATFILCQKGAHTFLYDKEHNRREILQTIDRTAFGKVWMSESGDSLLCQDKDKVSLLGIVDGKEEVTVFDNMNFMSHYNGYHPLFRFDRCRKPVMVDPLTKQIINGAYLAKYVFVSPDCALYAATSQSIKYKNLLLNSYVSLEDYRQLLLKFNGSNSDDNKESDKEEKEMRRRLLVQNNLSFYEKIYRRSHHLNNITQSMVIEYYSKLQNFVKTFIEIQSFVIVKETGTEKTVEEIPLGPPLWFLNYVSFSYDHRFVAIAGRYPNSTEFGGLFLVYDLRNHEVTYSSKNSWAVWSTAFTKNGLAAAYSSEPITFINNSPWQFDKEHFNDIEDRNFLTFSPDGEFYALSNQGYVAFNSKKREELGFWGHLPSSRVFVRRVRDNSELMEFNDLSDDGIVGISSRRGMVASVSFSNDNKKLMMVGHDGVIVVRNLHLTNS